MIIVVDHVTCKDEEDSKETVAKTAERQPSKNCSGPPHEQSSFTASDGITALSRQLNEISFQNRWVIAVYKELDMNMLEDCMTWFSSAMQKFKVCG